jgi:hypothetical protein
MSWLFNIIQVNFVQRGNRGGYEKKWLEVANELLQWRFSFFRVSEEI